MCVVFTSSVLIVTSEAPATPPALTPVEAAARLGVAPATVRRWLASGELEGVRIVGRLRVAPEALDRLLRPARQGDAA